MKKGLVNIPDGRLFALDTQTLISVAIHLFNLIVLCFAMTKLLYNPVREFLYNRTHRIDEQFIRARDEMAEADGIRREYEGRLRDIGLERDRLLEEARKDAEEQRTRVLAEAAEAVKHMKEKAAEDIIQMKLDARDEMKRAIIDASSAMAERIVSRALDGQASASMFDQAISDLEESSWWE